MAAPIATVTAAAVLEGVLRQAPPSMSPQGTATRSRLVTEAAAVPVTQSAGAGEPPRSAQTRAAAPQLAEQVVSVPVSLVTGDLVMLTDLAAVSVTSRTSGTGSAAAVVAAVTVVPVRVRTLLAG